jgi:hypothetical protein
MKYKAQHQQAQKWSFKEKRTMAVSQQLHWGLNLQCFKSS